MTCAVGIVGLCQHHFMSLQNPYGTYNINADKWIGSIGLAVVVDVLYNEKLHVQYLNAPGRIVGAVIPSCKRQGRILWWRDFNDHRLIAQFRRL